MLKALVRNIEKEHVIGVIIGLIPLITIAVLFRNDNESCIYYLKHCFTINSSILTLIGLWE